MMHYNRGVPASQQGVYDLVLEHDGLSMSAGLINTKTHKYKDRYGLLQLLSNLGIVSKMTAVIWREFSQLDFFLYVCQKKRQIKYLHCNAQVQFR